MLHRFDACIESNQSQGGEEEGESMDCFSEKDSGSDSVVGSVNLMQGDTSNTGKGSELESNSIEGQCNDNHTQRQLPSLFPDIFSQKPAVAADPRENCPDHSPSTPPQPPLLRSTKARDTRTSVGEAERAWRPKTSWCLR